MAMDMVQKIFLKCRDPISGYSSLSGDCNDLDSFTNPSALMNAII